MRPIFTDVARSMVLVAHCCMHTGEFCKTAEPIETFAGRVMLAKVLTCIKWRCTLAPPGDYD